MHIFTHITIHTNYFITIIIIIIIIMHISNTYAQLTNTHSLLLESEISRYIVK